MKLMNQVEDMSEIDRVHAFVRGLAPRTRAEAGSPKSLDDAIRIASDYESHHFRSMPFGHGNFRRLEGKRQVYEASANHEKMCNGIRLRLC